MARAIITGTTRGLGAALADQFQSVGWQVLPMNRPDFDLSLLDMQKAEQFFASIPKGEPIVFVNNAASLEIMPAHELDEDTIRREMTVNVISPMALISAFQRAHPLGAIANITSGAAQNPIGGWSLYCTAKAAMEGFMRSLANEGALTFNLSPGLIDTDMQAGIRRADFPRASEFQEYKTDGQLRPPKMVARNFVFQITRAMSEQRQSQELTP